MFKSKIDNTYNKDEDLTMSDLEPLQLAQIVDEASRYNGHIVMRTASIHNIEIFDISHPSESRCWTGVSSNKVKLLPKGFRITLEVI